jgi:hypothetical protein
LRPGRKKDWSGKPGFLRSKKCAIIDPKKINAIAAPLKPLIIFPVKFIVTV